MMKLLSTGAMLSSVILISTQTNAGIIAQDSFSVNDYTAGNIKNQNPATPGFSGDWDTTTSGYHSQNSTSYTAAIPNIAGYIHFPGGSSPADRQATRSLTSYVGSGTYYFSFVSIRRGWGTEDTYANGTKKEVSIGFSNTGNTEQVGIGYAFRNDDSSTVHPSLVIKAGGQNVLASIGESNFNDVLTTVMKLELDVSGSQDRLSWYVANGVADFSTEANANLNATTKGTLETDILSSATSLSQLLLRSPDRSGQVNWDEAAFTTTWAEAVGEPVPEPASFAMLGLGALLGIRRGKQKIA
ncbi:PEP-CTERM sorting domain-containing protein [Poriferisphaera sp. WC338]|uniref:PEP-CTERM sorting domain-containing protein n=1 Tax=Poriferisphaera sp. WC338 TaxID=3425129 RepID=UPI003D819013